MIKEAIEYIKNLSQPTIQEIDGTWWREINGYMVPVEKQIYRESALEISTLTGLKDYIDIERPPEESFFHVINHSLVWLITKPDDIKKKRTSFIQALVAGFEQHYEYMDIEQFMVLINTGFAPAIDNTGDTRLEDIASLLSHIKDEKTVDFEDNGMNQNISMKNKLQPGQDALKAEIPNPLKLRPYRTFTEIQQPQSQFVMRMRRGQYGPEVALFESKSKQWEIEAIQNIRKWLTDNIKDIPVIA